MTFMVSSCDEGVMAIYAFCTVFYTAAPSEVQTQGKGHITDIEAIDAYLILIFDHVKRVC